MDPKELAKILAAVRQKWGTLRNGLNGAIAITIYPTGQVSVYLHPYADSESDLVARFGSLEEFATELLIPY
jgi:hypothetical protein